MPATASQSSFVLNCGQKMTHLINFFNKGGGFDKNSLAATELKYISQNYHFQYDGSAVFERCTNILKHDAKG